MPTASGWSRPFDEPIPLPDGGELRTLLDAGRYVDALPRSMHEREEWQTVMEVLLSAVEGREPRACCELLSRWPCRKAEAEEGPMKFAIFVRLDGKQVYINPKLVTAIVQKFDKLSEIHIVGGSSVEIELPAAQVVEEIEKASDAD